MLNVDVVEGKELDHAKEFVAACGRPSTATTLRLVAPYKGKGKTVIADSWFGSCRTAEWLRDACGLYCILCVKNGHSGFCKDKLKEAIGGVREASAFFKVDVQCDRGVKTFYAGGHLDKMPLYLIATAGTSLEGPKRKR